MFQNIPLSLFNSKYPFFSSSHTTTKYKQHFKMHPGLKKAGHRHLSQSDAISRKFKFKNQACCRNFTKLWGVRHWDRGFKSEDDSLGVHRLMQLNQQLNMVLV